MTMTTNDPASDDSVMMTSFIREFILQLLSYANVHFTSNKPAHPKVFMVTLNPFHNLLINLPREQAFVPIPRNPWCVRCSRDFVSHDCFLSPQNMGHSVTLYEAFSHHQSNLLTSRQWYSLCKSVSCVKQQDNLFSMLSITNGVSMFSATPRQETTRILDCAEVDLSIWYCVEILLLSPLFKFF